MFGFIKRKKVFDTIEDELNLYIRLRDKLGEELKEDLAHLNEYDYDFYVVRHIDGHLRIALDTIRILDERLPSYVDMKIKSYNDWCTSVDTISDLKLRFGYMF